MEKSEFVQMILDETGRSDKQELVERAVDNGLVTIGLRHSFREMFDEEDLVASSGELYVELPAEVFQVRRVERLDGSLSGSFEIRTKQWVRSRWRDVEALPLGTPVNGYIEKGRLYLCPGRLYLCPVPSGETVLRVSYVKLPVWVEGQPLPVPTVMEALTAWVKSRLFGSLELFDRAVYGNGEVG